MEIVMINKYFNEAEAKYQRIEMDLTEPVLSQLIASQQADVAASPEAIADAFVDTHESIMEKYLATSKEGMRQKTRMISLGYLMFHEAGVDMCKYHSSVKYYK